eukprot:85121-Hanusia_phi.AAC.10
MAEWNATVVMACRDEKRGEIAAKDVRSSLSASSKGEVMVWKLDLESFDSIRTFAQKFRATGETSKASVGPCVTTDRYAAECPRQQRRSAVSHLRSNA